MDAILQKARRTRNQDRQKDVRSEWERDSARLIHSSAFRRLQSKTQVLGLGESDFYRTRLTHSMEVAQIGTGILRFLNEKYQNNPIKLDLLPDYHLMNAICLAHDIGHPPFGHGGEVALNYCMKNDGGFEGNGQTLRILSRLDKYTEQHGINPTRRMLLGVLKYPVNYDNVVNAQMYDSGINQIAANGANHVINTRPSWLFKSKFLKPPKCYHASEQDIVDWILEPFSDSDRALFTSHEAQDGKHRKPIYKSLDTSIMELADDISYGIHDLEDAISLGMVTRKKWEASLNVYEERKSLEEAFTTFQTNITTVADQLFESSYIRKNCIGDLVNIMITSAYIIESSSNFNEPLIRNIAKLDDNAEIIRAFLFSLVKEHAIMNPNVQQLEFKGQRLVVELFEALANDPHRFLPEKTKETFEKSGQNIRVICDFVAGMTDDYCTRYYERMLLPRKGSIFEHL